MNVPNSTANNPLQADIIVAFLEFSKNSLRAIIYFLSLSIHLEWNNDDDIPCDVL